MDFALFDRNIEKFINITAKSAVSRRFEWYTTLYIRGNVIGVTTNGIISPEQRFTKKCEEAALEILMFRFLNSQNIAQSLLFPKMLLTRFCFTKYFPEVPADVHFLHGSFCGPKKTEIYEKFQTWKVLVVQELNLVFNWTLWIGTEFPNVRKQLAISFQGEYILAPSIILLEQRHKYGLFSAGFGNALCIRVGYSDFRRLDALKNEQKAAHFSQFSASGIQWVLASSSQLGKIPQHFYWYQGTENDPSKCKTSVRF